MVLKRLWTGRSYFSDIHIYFLVTKYYCSNCDLEYGFSSRFAQFLTKPLMSADATMREIKTIDSG
jgi:secreted Zn-dependent insulinase-like peptidase